MKKIFFSILSVMGLGLASPAQQSLSLAEALSLALENNYDVKTASVNLSIARNNNSAGEAGYLPNLTVSSGYTENISNSRQQYYDGRLREATDARSNSLTAGASLQWTLFDGLGMWLTDKKLDLLEKTEELILRDKMEATLATVTTTYLEAVQQTKRIETLRNTLRYDHQLLNLSRKRWAIGMGSELDYLKVVADLNADSAALLRQEASLRASLIVLNTLLAIDPETTPVLTDTLTTPANPPLTFEELSAPLESNAQIVQATVRAEVARYESRIARSVQYPRLQFAAGYSYTKSTSATGLVESNRSFGPSAGISLSYTLFDGFKSRHKIANADLTTQNANLQADQTRLAIRATLQTLFSRYEAGLRLVSLQQSNLLVVKKNLDVAFSAYKSGQMAGIDLRQYQIQLLDATDNLLQSQYDLKVTETELLRLSGRILP